MILISMLRLVLLAHAADGFLHAGEKSSFLKLKRGQDSVLRSSENEYEELQLGAIPFVVDEVLLPGQSRYIHLYEARFLALFEDSMQRNDLIALAYVTEEGILLAPGAIARIEKWQRLDVGVGATIRAINRMLFVDLEKQDADRPFIMANVKSFSDEHVSIDDRLLRTVLGLSEQLEELADRHSIALQSRRDPEIDPRAVLLADDTQNKEKEIKFAKNLHERATQIAKELNKPFPDIVSYLALESADPEVRVRSLAKSTNDRLLDAFKQIKLERDELTAKAAIKSLNLDSNSLGDDV